MAARSQLYLTNVSRDSQPSFGQWAMTHTLSDISITANIWVQYCLGDKYMARGSHCTSTKEQNAAMLWSDASTTKDVLQVQ